MGFGSEVVHRRETGIGELLRSAEPDDLLQFGLIPELIGRLPIMTTLDELDESMLMRILLEPKNALVKQYQRLFHMDGIRLEFEEEAFKAVVKLAMKKKTGARALRSILESRMLEIMFELPSMDEVDECLITEGVILKGERPVYRSRQEAKKRSRA